MRSGASIRNVAMTYANGPDGRIAYRRLHGPPGRTPILFLHPVNTGGRAWSAMASDLHADRGSLAPDLRGHGDSNPGSSYLPVDYARDALAVLDDAGVDRVHLVGGSLGGAITAELTALAPDRVASITLFGASLRIGLSRDQTAALLDGVREHGVEGFFRTYGPDVLGPAALPSAAPELVALASSGRDPATVRDVIIGAFELADSRAVARSIAATPPTLVVLGTHDPTCPMPMARELADALGAGEPVVMTDVGHLPMLEAPAASAELVRTFLDRVETRPTPSKESV